MGAGIKIAVSPGDLGLDAALQEMIQVAAVLKEHRRVLVDEILIDIPAYLLAEHTTIVTPYAVEQIRVALEAYRDSSLPSAFCRTVFAEARKRGAEYMHECFFCEDIDKIIQAILRPVQLPLDIDREDEDWSPLRVCL